MKQFLRSTAFTLIIAILIGSLLGLAITCLRATPLEASLQVLMIIKHITSQLILFMVPLIIFGCVAPSITRFSGNVGSLLGFTLVLAYLSSLGAAFLSIFSSRTIVPFLHMGTSSEAMRALPEKMLITLNFPTIDTMSTLLLALLVGLGVVWTKFTSLETFLDKFQTMVLTIVKKVLLPVLPFFIGANFALIAYKGQLGQMKSFLFVLLLIVLCQIVWMVIMYVAASVYSRRNGWLVAKYYPKAYFTALGTMSSAATLPFALECIAESPVVKKDTADFALPLFSNLHLCGSVIAEMALVTSVYYILFGALPALTDMMLFALLACVIAIGSPGVPGGLNMSCITIVGSIVLVSQSPEAIAEFFGIMTAIYTVQDGFGTACNVTTDGALALMTDKYISSKN
ncbi:MAG: dicarboxylate/amino acid:cation symporter [Muribaculaceae bacterium]|nr:dicarboxylate/amino acid:cation symporter [Muribaculaceae bacterium]